MSTIFTKIVNREIPAYIVHEDQYHLAFLDVNPIKFGHTLVIPKRHAVTYFDLTEAEVLACNNLIQRLRISMLKEDTSIDGFNIGMNAGEMAGQTIFHCHIHLIPRRKGDVDNPRGGIRHLIPGKGFYQATD